MMHVMCSTVFLLNITFYIDKVPQRAYRVPSRIYDQMASAVLESCIIEEVYTISAASLVLTIVCFLAREGKFV